MIDGCTDRQSARNIVDPIDDSRWVLLESSNETERGSRAAAPDDRVAMCKARRKESKTCSVIIYTLIIAIDLLVGLSFYGSFA